MSCSIRQIDSRTVISSVVILRTIRANSVFLSTRSDYFSNGGIILIVNNNWYGVRYRWFNVCMSATPSSLDKGRQMCTCLPTRGWPTPWRIYLEHFSAETYDRRSIGSLVIVVVSSSSESFCWWQHVLLAHRWPTTVLPLWPRASGMHNSNLQLTK